MLTSDEIIKEQMFQTTSKKVLRSSEKRKPRAYVPHTSYVRTEGFVQAMACYFEIEGFMRAMACYAYYIYTTLRQFINHQDFLLNNLKTPQMISQ